MNTSRAVEVEPASGEIGIGRGGSYRGQGFRQVKQRFHWGPADGHSGMLRNVELVRTVREAIGADVELAADAYMGWDLDYARRMVRLLEPYDLRWLEEPLLPDDIGGYRALTAQSSVSIAAGEREATLAGSTSSSTPARSTSPSPMSTA